jgi:hypothetical protein
MTFSRISIDDINISFNFIGHNLLLPKKEIDLKDLNDFLYELTNVKMSYVDIYDKILIRYKINSHQTYDIRWNCLDYEKLEEIIEEIIEKIPTEGEIN